MIIKKTEPVTPVLRTFTLRDVMGDYYITDVVDNFKTNQLSSDIILELYDNYEDVQLGKSTKNYQLIQIGYIKGTLMEQSVETFMKNILQPGLYDVYSFDTYTPSGISKFIVEINSMLDEVDSKEDLLMFTKSVLFNYGVDAEVVENITEDLRYNRLDITKYKEEDCKFDRGVVGGESTSITETEEENPYALKKDSPYYQEASFKPNPTDRMKYFISFTMHAIANKLLAENNISVSTIEDMSDEEVCAKINAIVEGTKAVETSVVTEVEETEETTEDIEKPEVSEEIEEVEIAEDISQEELDKYVATETNKEILFDENKMLSERALELVKLFNTKWLKDIFPNLMHKLESIEFFKSNIDKYKINPGDKPEDIVSKVSGGVVHVEILKKNLSKWNNDDENWKTNDKKTIKKSQKAWRKEFIKFKNSILDQILPLVKNILAVNEEVEIIEDDDSIDMCIVNKTEPVKNTTEVVETSSSMESTNEATNIYNMVSLESLMEKSTSDEELFELILATENLEDREAVLNRAIEFNIFNRANQKNPLDVKIKRRVKVSNLKY